jgi:putative nucleotidyltransferase with HDIG domain
MTGRELASGVVVGGGFVLAIAALWLIAPPKAFVVWPCVWCVLVLMLATRVEFATPAGYSVPTQLAFVPLLFVMPSALVPIAVALAWLVGRIPEVLTGELPRSRLLQLPGNSWYAIGPAAVFVAAGVQARHAGAALLLAALAAQFVLDWGVGGLRDAIARGTTISAQLRDAWVFGVDGAFSIVGLMFARQVVHSPALVFGLLPLIAVLATFARERHRRLDGLLELNRAYRGTALALGEVVEADDGYTGEHCKGVLDLALAVADRLQLCANQRRNVEFAALLHDVGKIAIPKEILNKPGKLDPEEWAVMKSHTVEGQKVLARVGGFMEEVGRVVRSHHERWDGHGYPDGLSGEQIPLEARIIACCDSWNAMRTDRVYRNALSYEVARSELVGNAGSQFDPRVVEVLLSVTEGEPALEPAADGSRERTQLEAQLAAASHQA